jgi:TetR/AcrR family transcriptional regulator, cholesterol catabolism regulator
VSGTVSRRVEILHVARRQIAERGYTETSVRDIAEAVGLMAGSLYSHFRSKAEMVHEIVRGFYDELIPAQRAVLEQEDSGAVRYSNMIAAVFDVCAAHREELTILHYDWATLSTLDELGDVKAQSLETLDLWLEVLADGSKDGSLLSSIDPGVMVRVTTSSIHALLDTVRYSDRPLPPADLPHQRSALQHALLGGVATDRSLAPPPPARRRRAPRTAAGVAVDGSSS